MVVFAGQLVGRAEELGLLDRALAELDRGRGGALALAGEPGIGKSRLLAELAAHAESRRQLVLSGSASEFERDLPFWVFVDALEEFIQGLGPHRLDALDDEARSELALVFPSLSRFASASGAALPHERYRCHRAVRDLL
jgi:predicted ATPase